MPTFIKRIFAKSALLFTLLSFPSLGAAPKVWAIKGDVNADGAVDAADITALEALLSQPAVIANADADMDSDNLVDSYDLFRLQEVVNGSPVDIRLPIRAFTMNTGALPLAADPNASGYENVHCEDEHGDGVCMSLTETIPDFPFPLPRGGSIEWLRKGKDRHADCAAQPINIKSGKRSNKIPGMSTYDPALAYPYNPNPLLRTQSYRKLRVTPECETRDTSPNPIPVLLREYFTTTLFRSLKVPAPEIVAFARVTHTASPGVTTAGTFDSLFIQRDDEEDDVLPFVNQFGYCSTNWESRDNPAPACTTHRIQEGSDPTSGSTMSGDWFTTVAWQNGASGSFNQPGDAGGTPLRLDVQHSIRYLLLSDFAMVEDHGPFENENYDYDPVEGRWNAVPSDFDFSLVNCSFNPPGKVREKIEASEIAEADRPALWHSYYDTAREIFNNPNNLNQLLKIVDRYPFDGDKNRLKHLVKARFYSYALYFGSQAFAELTGTPFTPFENQDLYWREVRRLTGERNEFAGHCSNDLARLDDLLQNAAPPTITSQPEDKSVPAGSVVQFQVTATPAGLTYQWQKDGVSLNNGGRISGAASPTLQITSITTDDQGQYRCVVSKDQNTATSRAASLTVNGNPPVVSAVDDTAIDEDSAIILSFTVSDLETAAGDLAVAAFSDNEGLVPNDRIEIEGSDGSRTVKVTPLPNKNGTAVITLRVKDSDSLSTTEAFTLTVRPINDLPTLGAIPSQTPIAEGELRAIELQASDVETPLESLVLSVSATRRSLFSRLEVVKQDGKAVLLIQPVFNQPGQATLTVTLKDEAGDSAPSQSLDVQVLDADSPPAFFTNSTEISMEENHPYNLVLEYGDDVTLPENVGFEVTSTNDGLIPNENIVVSGYTRVSQTRGQRTLTLTPLPNRNSETHGTTTLVVVLNDGVNPPSIREFVVTVKTNHPPVAQNATLASGTGGLDIVLNTQDPDGDALAFTILDRDSSDKLEHGGTLTGSGPALHYTPDPDFSGSETFRYLVSDGKLASNTATVRITVTKSQPPFTITFAVTPQARTSQRVPLSASVQTSGIVPNDVSYHWTQKSGPEGAMAVIANPLSLNTDVQFPTAGNYVLTFTVNVGNAPVVAKDVPFTVQSGFTTTTVNIIKPGGSASAQLGYNVTQAGSVEIKVYDRLGNEIITLPAPQSVGPQTASWNGQDSGGNSVPSGIYVVVLKVNDSVDTRKVVVLR